MRLFLMGLLAGSVAVTGCTSAAAPASTGSTAAPPAAAVAGDSASAAGGAAPRTREITVPAGTTLPIVLETAVGSDISQVEQPVRAHLSKPVTVEGVTAIPEGSVVTGVVTDATRSGKVKGLAHVSVRFDSLSEDGQQYAIQTSAVGRTAESTKEKDAVEIGAPAVGGAIVGGLIGGGKGAAIGAAAGGGAGTAVVLSTRGKEVRLGRGAAMTLRLAEPLTVKVKS